MVMKKTIGPVMYQEYKVPVEMCRGKMNIKGYGAVKEGDVVEVTPAEHFWLTTKGYAKDVAEKPELGATKVTRKKKGKKADAGD